MPDAPQNLDAPNPDMGAVWDQLFDRATEKRKAGRPSTWRSGPTKLIKVPEAIARQVMDLARVVDEGRPVYYDTHDSRRAIAQARLLLADELARLAADRHAHASRQVLRQLGQLLEEA